MKVKWTVTGDFQRKKVVRLLILWNLVDRRPHTSLGFDLDKAPGLTSPTRGLEQPEFVGTAYVSLPTKKSLSYLLVLFICIILNLMTYKGKRLHIYINQWMCVELKGCGLHCLSSLLALISYETQKQIVNFLLRSMC